MSTTGRPYAVMNLVGSVLLAGVAASEELWAFVVLNTVWGLISVRRIIKPSARGPAQRDEKHAA